jgi:putative sterol carrier protein
MNPVQESFENSLGRFDREAALGFSAVFQLLIPDGADYYLIIDNGECEYHPGNHESADITLILNHDTLLRVVNGEVDGAQAFAFGQVKVDGDLALAKKLLELFPHS